MLYIYHHNIHNRGAQITSKTYKNRAENAGSVSKTYGKIRQKCTKRRTALAKSRSNQSRNRRRISTKHRTADPVSLFILLHICCRIIHTSMAAHTLRTHIYMYALQYYGRIWATIWCSYAVTYVFATALTLGTRVGRIPGTHEWGNRRGNYIMGGNTIRIYPVMMLQEEGWPSPSQPPAQQGEGSRGGDMPTGHRCSCTAVP
jgi:hypothetical protein